MNNDIIFAVHSNHPQKITVFVDLLFTQREEKKRNEMQHAGMHFSLLLLFQRRLSLESSFQVSISNMIVRFIAQ